THLHGKRQARNARKAVLFCLLQVKICVFAVPHLEGAAAFVAIERSRQGVPSWLCSTRTGADVLRQDLNAGAIISASAPCVRPVKAARALVRHKGVHADRWRGCPAYREFRRRGPECAKHLVRLERDRGTRCRKAERSCGLLPRA